MKFDRLTKSEIIFKIIAYTMIGIFAIITLYPIIYAFSVSISGKLAYEAGQIILLPKDIMLDAYRDIVTDKMFWQAYTNTLFYTVFGTFWSMALSLTGAYALSKDKLIGKRRWNFLLVFTMWFSAGMVPMFLNYRQLGVDSRLGTVMGFGVQAFNIILLRNYFTSIPTEIEEAATIDGANEFQVFTKIYIPMSGASIATVTLFYAISRWNGFYWASVLLAPRDQPLQVYLRQTIESYTKIIDEGNANFTYAPDSFVYAIIMCSIIPILVIYPYITRYFARGVNVGGVKG